MSKSSFALLRVFHKAKQENFQASLSAFFVVGDRSCRTVICIIRVHFTRSKKAISKFPWVCSWFILQKPWKSLHSVLFFVLYIRVWMMLLVVTGVDLVLQVPCGVFGLNNGNKQEKILNIYYSPLLAHQIISRKSLQLVLFLQTPETPPSAV